MHHGQKGGLATMAGKSKPKKPAKKQKKQQTPQQAPKKK
jgi:hypothetical protein